MTSSRLSRTEDGLHEAAIRKSGLEDFGDPRYRNGLRVLLNAFDNDMRLSESGSRVVFDLIVQSLVARLYTQKGWVEHPDALSIPIVHPIVITGLPRTGTTALHRLLCEDSQFQGLENWLSETPMARPPRDTWETHPAYCECVANLEALYSRVPQLHQAHDAAAIEVQECTALLAQSFMSDTWSALGLPTYGRWFRNQSAHPSYRRYADVLRLIAAHEPHKRWLLKSPHHIARMETLLETFPDAYIIQTHRDPLEVIPSYCSLVYMFRRDFEGQAAQSDAIGPDQCAYWREGVDRIQAVRHRSQGRFFDVQHRQFVANPLSVVRAIYEYFGLTLQDDVERRMCAWIAASPMSRHGAHRYSTDCWGVTADQVRTIFADYRAAYEFA